MRALLILAFLGYCGYLAYNRLDTPEVRLNANGDPMVRLYVHGKCGRPCDTAMDFLHSRKVAFEELDADEDWDDYKQIGGRNTFPMLISGSHTVHGFDPGKYQAAMADTLGRAGVSDKEWRALQNNFDASGASKVVMYSTKTCGYCTKTRKQFRSAGIDFTEIFIDRDATAKENFKTLFGNGTPLIFNGYKRQSGYSPRTIDTLI